MTSLWINKKKHELAIQGHETLLEVLRDNLSLTGTKTACSESECGTCMVIINGKAVLSCITLANDVAEEEITTIEGLADGQNLHPVQQAFLEEGAVQCGFCIPGMIMSSKALLDKNPEPTQQEIEYALDGNLCRCAGYLKIFQALWKAGSLMKNQNKNIPQVTKETKKEDRVSYVA